MATLGNQVEWAIHCVSVLATIPEGRYLPSQALSDFHGVPKEYLSKALQDLAKAGLIEGRLGPKGGYRLARAPKDITFLDVVEAVEGSGHSFRCTEIRKNIPCTPKGPISKVCAVAAVMYRADQAWRQVLRETTIADLGRTLARQLDPSMLNETQNWLNFRLSPPPREP